MDAGEGSPHRDPVRPTTSGISPIAAVGSQSPTLGQRRAVSQPEPTFTMDQMMSLVTTITKQAASSAVTAALSTANPPQPPRERGNFYLPPFDPDIRSHDIRDWCANVDETIAVFHITPQEARMKAILQLKGRAKVWADTWSLHSTTWEQVKGDLIKTFSKEFRYADDVQKWRSYTSDQAASYAEYATTAWTMFKRVRPEAIDSDVIDAVITGITPRRKSKPLNIVSRVRMVNPLERRAVACVLLAVTAVVAAASYDRERLEIAKQILEEVPLTDGHNDLPWNIRKFLRNQINDFELDTDLTRVEPWSISKYSHTDLPRLREGMVGAQFWSAFVPCASQNRDAVQLTLEQIDVIRRLVEKYPQYMQLATSVTDILQAHSARPRKIASLIGIEGGHSIGNSLGVLRSYYQLGVRYMTLTHTCNTPWADSSNEAPVVNGLSEFGEKVVKEMNRLGMLVDLSHVGENTTRAAIKLSKAPVIFSHSSVYSLCAHKRNVPTDIIHSLKENGGIIMVNFFPDFVKCAPNATLSDVAEHFHYIKRIVGADYVGIGGDFDGVNRVPRGLEDVSKYPELFAELLRSGQWSVQELKNLAGLNMLRVMRQVEKVRDEMRTHGAEPEEHPDSPNDNGNCTSNAFYTE